MDAAAAVATHTACRGAAAAAHAPHEGAAVAAAAPHDRAAAVFCRGALLDAVQRARLFGDAKTFVDMPLRHDPEVVLRNFEALPLETHTDPQLLRAFVEEHFQMPGAEMDLYVPPADSPLEPPFVTADGVKDPDLRHFALDLHGLWRTLSRVTAPAVLAAPQRYSMLPRRYPMVLPGGRFRETYYWDSLWIVQGLLSSGLLELAKGLVQNLLDDVDKFGFVPNGGRIYYLNRSQPPVLCAMVATVARHLDAEEEAEWLPLAVALLRREYDWWMNSEHAVRVGAHTLNRYVANWDEPRPESYWQDLETAEGDPRVYREIASAAETGWDFTARWTRAGGRAGGGGAAYSLRDAETSCVLPVDLNAILYHAERTLATLCEAVATGARLSSVEARWAGRADGSFSDPGAQAFAQAAKDRRAAIDELLWRPALGRWVDLWLPASFGQGGACEGPERLLERNVAEERAVTVADFAPALWAGLASPEQAALSTAALLRSGLVGVGGVGTTGVSTEEQWDGANAWAPMQAMLIEGLQGSGVPGGAELAAQLAQRWVGTCYAGWRSSGFMHEKYDSAKLGARGTGGEYEPQVGFAWSNGVALRLLETYGRKLQAPPVAPAVVARERPAHCMEEALQPVMVVA